MTRQTNSIVIASSIHRFCATLAFTSEIAAVSSAKPSMQWEDQGRFHVLGQWPGKVHVANGIQYWEWQHVFQNVGWCSTSGRFFKLRRRQMRCMRDAFSLTQRDLLRGKRFYESQKKLRHMVESAPRVDLISTRYLWSLLVDTAANGSKYGQNAERYFTFLLSKTCCDDLELPVVRKSADEAIEQETLVILTASGHIEVSPILMKFPCIGSFLEETESRTIVPFFHLLVAIRRAITTGRELEGMLYCLLDPLVRLTEKWVLETALPSTEIRTAGDLMPRRMITKKGRTLIPTLRGS